MKRQNCWEVKKCGREPGGAKVPHWGVCPAATATAHSGTNHGANAGRYCWRVAGTFCEGKVEATFANGLMSCSFCEFYQTVQDEEGDELKL